MQRLNLAARPIPVDAHQSRIDDVADPGNCQGSLRDIGRQDDPAAAAAGEHPLLFTQAQARKEREDFGVGILLSPEQLGGIANLAFSRKKDKNVTGSIEVVHPLDAVRHLPGEFDVGIGGR